MFLRVRLAHVGTGIRCDPHESLRHRLNVENVEGETAALMNEPRAHGPVRVIQINGRGSKTSKRLSFAERAVCHSALRLCGHAEDCQKQKSESLHRHWNLPQFR